MHKSKLYFKYIILFKDILTFLGLDNYNLFNLTRRSNHSYRKDRFKKEKMNRMYVEKIVSNLDHLTSI